MSDKKLSGDLGKKFQVGEEEISHVGPVQLFRGETEVRNFRTSSLET